MASACTPVQAVFHSWVEGRQVVGRAGPRRAADPSTGEPFAEVTLLDADQAAEAVGSAQAAFVAWSRTPIAARARRLDTLRRLIVDEADSIAALIEREQGKPAAEAYAVEILPSLDILRHLSTHAEEMLRDEELEGRQLLLAHKEARLVLEPIGVILAIVPWNYPWGLGLPVLAAALVAGNTVVLKPAPATTLVGLRLGELVARAGFPAGVASVLAVDDTVAAGLVEDPRLGKIVFTGSVATGRRVMAAAARNLTPVVLELGGKDPAIVCRDADLGRAAQGIAWAAFANCGQTCAAVERVYVERAVAEPFLARLLEAVRGIRVGHPASGPVEMGPMTLPRQRAVVEAHLADALAKGARLLCGGTPPSGHGSFFPPTVLSDVSHEMTVMREETFGPLLPVMVVDSLEQAIALANDTPYGLTASGWTRSEQMARRLQRELTAGVVSINDHASSFGEPTAPWGGVKWSGIGRTHGRLGLLEMVRAKYVSHDRGGGAELWWHPYDARFAALMRRAVPALHATGTRRLAALAGLLGSRRVWRRFGPLRLLRGIDRLF